MMLKFFKLLLMLYLVEEALEAGLQGFVGSSGMGAYWVKLPNFEYNKNYSRW